MAFTFLAFAQVFQALASRSGKESLFKIGILSNPTLAGMALLVIALSDFFDVMPLRAMDLAIATGAGALVFVAMELEKVIKKSIVIAND